MEKYLFAVISLKNSIKFLSLVHWCKRCKVNYFSNTDWSKYFRGKRIHGDWDIRVEQAEFRELSVNSNSENGVTASIILAKSGNKVVRSFKPGKSLILSMAVYSATLAFF